jgi:hypothetical protein
LSPQQLNANFIDAIIIKKNKKLLKINDLPAAVWRNWGFKANLKLVLYLEDWNFYPIHLA